MSRSPADLGELPSGTFVQRTSSPHYVNADSPAAVRLLFDQNHAGEH
ncbi:MAG: hypothetical protein ABIW84_00825 [Ilumatobacteraceae bacterium]